MNKILATLAVSATLFSISALAEDTLRVSLENGKQRIDFSLNGSGKCVMIDEKITCQPVKQAPTRVASAESK